MSPFFMMVTFCVFFYFGNTILVAQAFAARHVFATLEDSVRWIPQFIGDFIEFLVSMRRIQDFLLCEEINDNIVKKNDQQLIRNGMDILLENANFSWAGKQTQKENENSGENEPIEMKDLGNSSNENEPILRHASNELRDHISLSDISLEVQKGEFIGIIGEVGSGKSSLLSAILGDMLYLNHKTIQANKNKILDEKLRIELHQTEKLEEAVVKLGGSVSYVQHSPWIQNKTIRDNILFDQPMDEIKYNKVIEICELGPDLELLQGGDLTEIGEKGINLSGGQKARISLARAVYADNDIFLMDDPVSAVDGHTKTRILENVFAKHLASKTVLLVTHSIDLLPKFDKIIVMKSGRITFNGTYQSLIENEDLKHIIESISEQEKEELSHQEEETKDDQNNFISEEGKRITDEENEESIHVGTRIYWKFFTTNLIWLAYCILIVLLAVYSTFYVSYIVNFGYWIEDTQTQDPFTGKFLSVVLYPVIFSLIVPCAMTIIVYSVVRASRILHEKMLLRVCNAPINLYFDKTPSGRIMNRFSNDLHNVDVNIGQRVMWATESTTAFVYNLVIIYISAPKVVFVFPFAIGMIYLLLKYYMKTFRELSRLEGVTASPILCQVSETILGSTTIRSHGKGSRLVEHNYGYLDSNLNAGFWKSAVRRWFSIRLELTGRSIIVITLCLILYLRDEMNPILAGVFLSNVLALNAELFCTAKHLNEFESNLVNYERCLKMLEIPQEVAQRIPEKVQKSWPQKGSIEFQDYS